MIDDGRRSWFTSGTASQPAAAARPPSGGGKQASLVLSPRRRVLALVYGDDLDFSGIQRGARAGAATGTAMAARTTTAIRHEPTTTASRTRRQTECASLSIEYDPRPSYSRSGRPGSPRGSMRRSRPLLRRSNRRVGRRVPASGSAEREQHAQRGPRRSLRPGRSGSLRTCTAYERSSSKASVAAAQRTLSLLHGCRRCLGGEPRWRRIADRVCGRAASAGASAWPRPALSSLTAPGASRLHSTRGGGLLRWWLIMPRERVRFFTNLTGPAFRAAVRSRAPRRGR